MHMRTRLLAILAILSVGIACDGTAGPPDAEAGVDAGAVLDAGAPATADVFEREPNDRPPWAACMEAPCPTGEPTAFTAGQSIGGVISPPETTLPDRDLFVTHLGFGELLEVRVAGVDPRLELGVTLRAVYPDPRHDLCPMQVLADGGVAEIPALVEGDYLVIVEDARVARGEDGFWGGWYVLETHAWPPVPLPDLN